MNALVGLKTTEIVDAGILLRFLYADNLLKPVSIKHRISGMPDTIYENEQSFCKQMLIKLFVSKKYLKHLTFSKKQIVYFYNNRSTIFKNELKVEYHHSSKRQMGRVYADGIMSIGGLRSELRHTLSRGNYIDVDMENAHFALLNEHSKGQFENINFYVKHREECFEELKRHYREMSDGKVELTRKMCKDFFTICVLYGGSTESWLKKCDLMPMPDPAIYEKFRDDMGKVFEYVKGIYPDLCEEIEHDKCDPEASCISWFCQEEERKVLQVIYNSLLKNKFIKKKSPVVLMYDGLQIPISCSFSGTDALLKQLELDIIKETGYTIKLVVKPFDEAFTEEQLDFPMVCDDDDDDDVDYTFVSNDTEAGMAMFEKIKDHYIFLPTHGFYYKKDNLWVNEKVSIDSFVDREIIMSSLAYPPPPPKKGEEEKEQPKPSPYCKNASSMRNVRTTLDIFIRTRSDTPNVYEKFHTTTRQRLCFLDGVLDFQAKRFYAWDEIDFEYYTCVQIKRNFKSYFDAPDLEMVKEVKEKIYHTCYGAEVDTALHFLARAITGNPHDKKYGVLVGNRNCGKGVQYANLKGAFGDYVRTFELGNVLYNRETDTNETARMNYWLMDLEFARLGISQEIPVVEKRMKLDGKKWKRMCGGDDEQVARRNFDRVDTYFKIDTTFFIMGNNELLYDNPDIRTEEISFMSVVQFKPEDELEQMREMGVDEVLIQAYKVKNIHINELSITSEWANALVYLLYENWRENICVPVKLDADDNENKFIDFKMELLEKFTPVPDKEKFLLCKDVEAEFDEPKKKVSKELETLGVMKMKASSKYGETLNGKFIYIGIVKKDFTVINQKLN